MLSFKNPESKAYLNVKPSSQVQHLRKLKSSMLILLFSFFLFACETVEDGTERLYEEAFLVEQEFVLNEVLDAYASGEYKIQEIDTIHLKKGGGEVYKSLYQVKGILLKDILAKLDLENLNNKSFSSFLVKCQAQDGYKTIYSWNEIFNSKIGEEVYLIIEANGEQLKESQEGVMMASLEDFINGKRNLRGLDRIQVLFTS